MAVVATLLALLLLALVVFVVSGPLRAAARREARGEPPTGGPAEDTGDEAAEREALEVAREAKYREIRDAEMDYRTGKLSERDYRELDAELRAEALAILDRLEGGGEGAGPTPTDASAARSRSRRTGPRRRPSSD